MMHLSPADYVIFRFGGVRPLARKVKLMNSVVMTWRKKKFIPSKHMAKIIKLSEEEPCPTITPREIIYGKQVSATTLKREMSWLHDDYIRREMARQTLGCT